MTQRTLGDYFIKLAAHGSQMASSRRRMVYLLTLACVLAVIWLPIASLILFGKPSYTSSWTLVLPVTGSGHAVSLESVGQASTPSLSPYANNVVDPRINYKAIAFSQPVLSAAALKTGLKKEEFGEPRVKLIDQSALMHFHIKGATAEQAHQKAQALQAALNDEINRLRIDELDRREATAAEAISGFSEKLADSQRNIVHFQSQALITSLEQYRELTLSIERSRLTREQLMAKRQGLAARVQGLEKGLNLPPEGANAVLALQNDAVFQQLLENSASAEATLNDYASRWGNRHFKVIAARENAQGLHRSLLQRAARVARYDLTAEQLVDLANSGLTLSLMEELVTLRGELRGIDAELGELQAQIDAHKARIDAGAADAVALEDLQRKQQVATAVFTTALAKLDLGKTDFFSSYPMLQTLLPPTLPVKPDNLATNLALLGGIAATLMVLTGLLLLWIRKPYLQKIFQNA